jgi:soluble lytic murein transglycosylase
MRIFSVRPFPAAMGGGFAFSFGADWAKARRVKRWLPLIVVALLGLSIPLGMWWSNWRREHSQDRHILAAARRYGVDPSLIKAVVWKESRFNSQARGRAGEIGLMQLTDPAAQEWAEAEKVYPVPEEHLFNPGTNLLAGTWYLRKLLRRYQGLGDPLPYALADYNAGRNNVLKWAQGAAATNSSAFLEKMGFPGTKDYILSIRKRRERYWDEFPVQPDWLGR